MLPEWYYDFRLVRILHVLQSNESSLVPYWELNSHFPLPFLFQVDLTPRISYHSGHSLLRSPTVSLTPRTALLSVCILWTPSIRFHESSLSFLSSSMLKNMTPSRFKRASSQRAISSNSSSFHRIPLFCGGMAFLSSFNFFAWQCLL